MGSERPQAVAHICVDLSGDSKWNRQRYGKPHRYRETELEGQVPNVPGKREGVCVKKLKVPGGREL